MKKEEIEKEVVVIKNADDLEGVAFSYHAIVNGRIYYSFFSHVYLRDDHIGRAFTKKEFIDVVFNHVTKQS